MQRTNSVATFVLAVTIAVAGLVPTFAAGQSAAAGKSAITHESMWLMKRVGAPVPSPDGKWVVFSVTEPD